MRVKRVLRPEALRRIPSQFSWIDQWLVGEGYIERCDAPALALYLMLVTVADAQGLSYYGEASLSRCLSMDGAQLHTARQSLIRAGLIAYQTPLYQVLALDTDAPRTPGLRAIDATLERLQPRLNDRKRRGT